MLEPVRVLLLQHLVCGECCQQARSSNLLDSLIHACEPYDECEFIIPLSAQTLAVQVQLL